MKSVGCSLRLAQDKDDAHTLQTCELFIAEDRTWTLSRRSSDPELEIRVESGRWVVRDDGSGTGKTALYLFERDPPVIVLQLYGLGGDFLDLLACGHSLAGSGWRQGPPASNVVYDLWFACA